MKATPITHAEERSSGKSINIGKLTDQQVAIMETFEWHLESFPGDPDRLRFVYPSISRCGRWFSREWETVPWDFVRPSESMR